MFPATLRGAKFFLGLGNQTRFPPETATWSSVSCWVWYCNCPQPAIFIYISKDWEECKFTFSVMHIRIHKLDIHLKSKSYSYVSYSFIFYHPLTVATCDKVNKLSVWFGTKFTISASKIWTDIHVSNVFGLTKTQVESANSPGPVPATNAWTKSTCGTESKPWKPWLFENRSLQFLGGHEWWSLFYVQHRFFGVEKSCSVLRFILKGYLLYVFFDPAFFCQANHMNVASEAAQIQVTLTPEFCKQT